MNQGRMRDPQQVCVPFDSLSPGIPHQSVAAREVPGVPHRDHRIVEQREIALAAYHEARAIDEQRGVNDEGRDGEEEQDASAFPAFISRE